MLRFALTWDDPDPTSDNQDGWLQVWIGDTAVWGDKGTHWGWEYMLQHLATMMLPALDEDQDGWPSSLEELPQLPRIEGALFDRGEEEESNRLFEWRDAHDLANGLGGKWPPTVYVAREGDEILLWAKGTEYRGPFAEARAELVRLGDLIAERVAASQENWDEVLKDWKEAKG